LSKTTEFYSYKRHGAATLVAGVFPKATSNQERVPNRQFFENLMKKPNSKEL
jgi:hypothetical protein